MYATPSGCGRAARNGNFAACRIEGCCCKLLMLLERCAGGSGQDLSSPERTGKYRSGCKRRQAGDGEPPEQLGCDKITLGLKLDLLRPIDGFEGALNRASVRRPEESTARGLGDLSKGTFVQVRQHPPITHLAVVVVVNGHRHVSVLA